MPWDLSYLHISWVLKSSGISLIQRGTFSYNIFIYALGTGQVSNFMDRKNDTMHRLPAGVILSMQKTYENLVKFMMKNDDEIIEAISWIRSLMDV